MPLSLRVPCMKHKPPPIHSWKEYKSTLDNNSIQNTCVQTVQNTVPQNVHLEYKYMFGYPLYKTLQDLV